MSAIFAFGKLLDPCWPLQFPELEVTAAWHVCRQWCSGICGRHLYHKFLCNWFRKHLPRCRSRNELMEAFSQCEFLSRCASARTMNIHLTKLLTCIM